MADPSYGVSNKPIGDYQLGINTPSRSSYVTGTSRTGMAAGAEEKIWLRVGDGTGVSGTPGRKCYYYNGKYIDLQYIYGVDALGISQIVDYKIISYGTQ